MIELTLHAGWAGTLSLLGLVATGYGLIARTVSDHAQLQLCAGAVFGAIALCFIAIPLRVADGVNLDPRAVPVALAAAFLGLRGAAVTLFMAIGMRLAIGGAGTGAGVAVILFAAIAGFSWSQGTRPDERAARDYLRFGAMVGLGLWTIVLLPVLVAWRALSAAVPMVLLCMIFVPLTAFLMDRARTPQGMRRRLEA